MKEKVLYETGDFWVQKNSRGDFEVYRSGATHSTRVATIGRSLRNAYERAVNEAQRRHAVEAYAEGERLGYIGSKKETHMAAPKKRAAKKAAPKKRASKKSAPKKRAAKKAAPAKRKRAPRGKGLMTRSRIAHKGKVLGGVSRAIYASGGRPITVRIYDANETAKLRKK